MEPELLLALVGGSVALLGVGIALLVRRGRGATAPGAPESAAVEASEVPEVPSGRMVRLRSRLADSQSPLGRGLLAFISRDRLDDAAWQELEETL